MNNAPRLKDMIDIKTISNQFDTLPIAGKSPNSSEIYMLINESELYVVFNIRYVTYRMSNM